MAVLRRLGGDARGLAGGGSNAETAVVYYLAQTVKLRCTLIRVVQPDDLLLCLGCTCGVMKWLLHTARLLCKAACLAAISVVDNAVVVLQWCTGNTVLQT